VAAIVMVITAARSMCEQPEFVVEFMDYAAAN